MKRIILLATLLLVISTIRFYGQTATDSCGIWLKCQEFSFYVNKVYESNDLKADTANLNFQLSKCDQEVTKLHEAVSAGKMALNAKNESLKTVQQANDKLTARVINAEGKMRFWQNTAIISVVVFIVVEGVRIATEIIRPH